MVKVGIYVRLSDEDRKQVKTDESESIQSKNQCCYEYCRERNWEVYDIYCDEDYEWLNLTNQTFNVYLQIVKKQEN